MGPIFTGLRGRRHLVHPDRIIAYTGESLDYKVPLLKALRAVNKAALDVMHYFDPSVKKLSLTWDGNKNISWLTKACMLPVRTCC